MKMENKSGIVPTLAVSCEDFEKIKKSIEEKDKEIERLNNIINELEKEFEEELKNLNYSEDKIYAQGIHDTIISHKYKLQELKGSESND